jgi:hypothetical protein
MGNLSKMHKENKFSKPKMGKKVFPLRKIIGYTDDGKEQLECGHTIYPPQDFIGSYPATKRRCWRCVKNEVANA